VTRHPPPPLLRTALTADGALSLAVPADARRLVDGWLPHHLALSDAAERLAADRPAAASIVAHGDVHEMPVAAGDAAATFGPVAVRASSGRLALDTATTARGDVDLAARRATLVGDPAAPDDVAAVHAMLTVAAAALLGRLARALVHAAAVVDPEGRAWLLVGDTHAGKSTTCATLLEAGWRYTSDDHVVLSADGDAGVRAEGWPRVLHLDRGWTDGRPAGGERAAVDALARWPGRWQPAAPVGGVLLPSVDADAPTRLGPASPAERLAMLVRQAPWLFVDATAAPAMLALLQRTALLPGAALRLGRDTFRRPDRLQAVLAPLLRDGAV